MRTAPRFPTKPGSRTYHILAALLLAGAAYAQTQDGLTEAAMEISINGEEGGETLIVLRDGSNGLWLDEADFARLRLHTPPSRWRDIGGHHYYSLNAISDATVTIDEALQHVTLRVPAGAFEQTRVHTARRRETPLTQTGVGGFLNYQLLGQRIGADPSAGLLTELGVFGGPGVLTNTFAGRAAEGSSRGIRLDTALAHDLPSRLQTLTLGDSISNPGSWGSAIRFGGVHWGRNFGLRPDLVTAPLLTVGGSAVVPSTVDVLVNGQRISSQSVPAGPFVIDQLPAVSGSGDLRLVVRDALGNVQTITRPFYSGVNLLARGLDEFSFDAGVVRENYALESFRYGGAMVTGNYRRGLTDQVTFGTHAEWQAHDSRAVGADLGASVGSLGVMTLTTAHGGNTQESGWLTGVGLERHGKRLSATVSTFFATDGFHQLSDSSLAGAHFKQRTLAQLGASLGQAGSLALAWVTQTYRASEAQRVLSLSYNLRVSESGWLSLTVSHSSGTQASSIGYLNYTLALGERRSLSTNLIASEGAAEPARELFTTLAQNVPLGPGTGWRLGAATSGNFEADWQGRTSAVDVELEAARNQGITGERGIVKGAMTWLDGDVRPARAVTGSFAVVEVAGLPDIPVYLDNQFVARTDAAGRAVLHDLRPYEPNRVSVDPEELPLDTSIENQRLTISPPYRSGVVARFPIERVRGGTFRLVTSDGKPVPAGALVRFNGGTFQVALNGTTYVTTLDHGTTGEASWGNARCIFRVPPPPSDPLPDMGTIVCKRHPAAQDANGEGRP